MHRSTDGEPQSALPRSRRGRWRFLGRSALLALVVLLAALLAALLVAGEIVVRRAGPIVKGRVVETLSTRFNSRVELDQLDVSLVRGLQVTGEGLRIFPPNGVLAAGVQTPIIVVRRFAFHASLRGLFLKPTRVALVQVSGLEIRIPPRRARLGASGPYRPGGKIKIVVDHIVCEDSLLVIENAEPGKEPKTFVLQRIALDDTGSPTSAHPERSYTADSPWRYDATLINALPRGNIHAVGTFGPWDNESPGDSLLTGHYTFDHADLNPIKGIGGILSSVGDFHGQLNRIDVTGTTDTPDFSLDTANQPVPLRTRFHAMVDGTTGNTTLDPVQGRLRNSAFTCRGTIVNVRGKGHMIDLDVDIPAGSLQDFLALAVRTRPVYLTALLTAHAKLHIHPGKQSVMQKLALQSNFTLRQIHFTNPAVQSRLDELSLRAQGRPAEAKPGAPAVNSQIIGRLQLNAGRMTFDNLDYNLPGANIQLTGIYSLDGEQFDFHGKVRTQARLSEMVSSWWKQLLLKPVDGFFAKNGAGTEIPVRISGTRSEPSFGLDFGHADQKDHNQRKNTPTGTSTPTRPPRL